MNVQISVTPAELEVILERRRQVEEFGFDEKHDSEHSRGELLGAALHYMLAATHIDPEQIIKWPWKWPAPLRKSESHRRNLVKAVAVLIAEIECINRVKVANKIMEYGQ